MFCEPTQTNTNAKVKVPPWRPLATARYSMGRIPRCLARRRGGRSGGCNRRGGGRSLDRSKRWSVDPPPAPAVLGPPAAHLLLLPPLALEAAASPTSAARRRIRDAMPDSSSGILLSMAIVCRHLHASASRCGDGVCDVAGLFILHAPTPTSWADSFAGGCATMQQPRLRSPSRLKLIPACHSCGQKAWFATCHPRW